jgi:diguanylate cyclase (GGDEF)-like protein
MARTTEEIVAQGRGRTAAVVTVVSVLFSVCLTALLDWTVKGRVYLVDLGFGGIIPLIITPIVSYRVVALMCELHQTRHLVEHHARADSLTGLFNRRHFTEAAELLLADALKTSSPMAVAIIDVDRFKDVNDTHGHLVGDSVLSEVAKAIRSCTRDNDLLARYGGDEFVIVLPRTNSKDAALVLDRIRGRLDEAHVGSNLPGDIRTTVSIGIASSDRSTATLHDLLSAADKLLYDAKRLGRDRTEYDGSEHIVAPSPARHAERAYAPSPRIA